MAQPPPPNTPVIYDYGPSEGFMRVYPRLAQDLFEQQIHSFAPPRAADLMVGPPTRLL